MTHAIFLHHYAASPFAEKVRLMLGYKGLEWHSVLQPSIMPKPHLQSLTGGYRRIPVLQIGADVVCDTALIADVLDRLAPKPVLVPIEAKGSARAVAQWADSQLFLAAMAYNFQPAGAAHFFKGVAPEVAMGFAEDRKAMRAGAARMAPGDATAAYRSYIRRIAAMLQPSGGAARNFLLGNTPSLADFACFHPLWFTQTQVPNLAAIFEQTPAIAPWLARMVAFGHGKVQQSDATKSTASVVANTETNSIFDAKNGNPEAFEDDHGIALGTKVQITAESFGLEPSVGKLVAATRTRLCIERQLPGTDATVRVHFPKVGFVLRVV